eukprot:m.150012 g.150012  ORF g.150012 m.150012 type:complete len:594 (+) comp30701_c0_seq2:251-2032(+)
MAKRERATYAEPTFDSEVDLKEELQLSSQEIKPSDLDLMEEQQPRLKSFRVKAAALNKRESKLGDVIGAGNFGVVKKGFVKETSNCKDAHGLVAVKCIPPNSNSKSSFLQEIMVMRQFKHQNVVVLKGHVTTGQTLMLLMELCDQALDDTLKLKGDKINIGIRMRYAMDCAKGLEYLQDLFFVHRDLAARNILLARGTCKIGDFGLSTPLAHAGDFYKSSGGKVPLRWCALETIRIRRFSLKTDIWSFGILLNEIFDNARLPYKKIRNMDLCEVLESGYRLPPVGDCPQKVYELMLRCWQESADNRPSAKEIYQEIFAVARFQQYELATFTHTENIEKVSSEPLGDEDAYEYTAPPPPPRTSRVTSPATSRPASSAASHTTIIIDEEDAFDLMTMIDVELNLRKGGTSAPQPPPRASAHKSNSKSLICPPLPPKRPSIDPEPAVRSPAPYEFHAVPMRIAASQSKTMGTNALFDRESNWFCKIPITRETSEACLMEAWQANRLSGIFLVRPRKDVRTSFVLSVTYGNGEMKHFTVQRKPPGSEFFFADNLLEGCTTLKDVVYRLREQIPRIKWMMPLLGCPGEEALANYAYDC